ncbi:MAG: hypothetical protein IPH63_05315 [Flavobacteriales bacterium]|nr:hypothetical protein [Flavobacteriales bacterium]
MLHTNDQNLLDNYHKGSRRGRSAAINMGEITSTGAGTAVSKGHPKSGRTNFTANAVRVPTPTGSLAIMNLTRRSRSQTLDAMNGTIQKPPWSVNWSTGTHFQGDPEPVRRDIIGDTCCSVFDSNATIVSPDGKRVVLYTGYDIDLGYTKQVIRLAKHVMKVRRLVYY